MIPFNRGVHLAAVAVIALSVLDSPIGPHQEQSEDGATIFADTVAFEVNEGTKLQFDVSPDGQTIVFDLLGQLWTLPAQGGVATPLTDAVGDTSEDLAPTFSPDGRDVFFRADRPGGRGLFKVSRDDPRVRRVAGAADGASIGLQGSRAAFVRRTGGTVGIILRDFAIDSRSVIPVDGLPGQNPPLSQLTWSPDGSTLLFVNAPAQRPGRLWTLPAEGGVARPLGDETVSGLAPSFSPDGHRVAYFAPDADGLVQLFVWDSAGARGPLTSHEDVNPLGVRWTPDGDALLYHADGRLWQTASTGGASAELPFTARVAFERRTSPRSPLEFPTVGSLQNARGFAGLALSPSGERIAILALDSVWVFEVGQRPRAIASVPMTAAGVAWSPDETQVAWSAGPGGDEDVYVTSVPSGTTARFTELPGSETRPTWSPDGRYLAFYHWQGVDGGRYAGGWFASLVVSPTTDLPIARIDSSSIIAQVPPPWGFGPLQQEFPQWSPDSRGLLVGNTIKWLDGDSLSLGGDVFRPNTAAFVTWSADGSITYVNNELMWRAERSGESFVTDTEPIVREAALYPTVSRDGSALYLSADGLSLWHPGGSFERLGWPITYQVPSVEPLLLSNVRMPGTGGNLRDILIVDGRIEAIAAPGETDLPRGLQVVAGEGRWVIPGLIDLHTHHWDDAVLPGALYYGVTTVRDMGSRGIARLVGHRDAIRAGVREGPRVVVGGVQFANARTGLSSGGIHGSSTDEAMGRAMRLLDALGARYVKMRWFSDWESATRLIGFAEREGWPVGGHEALQLPLVAAGIDGLEHLGPGGRRTSEILYDDMISLLRAAGMYVVPTLVTRYQDEGFALYTPDVEDPSALPVDDEPLVTPFLRYWGFPAPQRSEAAERSLSLMRVSAKRAHDRGVPVATGTDALAIPWAIHLELEQLVEAGLTAREALNAATQTAAMVLGADNEIGSLSPGAWGDLVLLDADPYDDIRNTRRIWMVIKNGVVVDRQELEAQITTRLTRPR